MDWLIANWYLVLTLVSLVYVYAVGAVLAYMVAVGHANGSKHLWARVLLWPLVVVWGIFEARHD